MLKYKNYLFIILIILITSILPFSNLFSDSEFEAVRIDESSIGYYQSRTCSISLIDVFLENIGNNNKIKYNNNNYVGIECFGKVTGLDKSLTISQLSDTGLDQISNTYIVSIGTNSQLTFVLQSIIWCLFLFLIRGKTNYNINFLIVLFLSLTFTFQHLSEGRFYSQVNKYYDASMTIKNYYLIAVLITYYLIFLYISIFIDKQDSTLINYVPFAFLFVGTFNGKNINFYLIILTYFGLKHILNKNFINRFNISYFIFSFLWFLSRRDSNSFFDTDKLRGFINSSNNHFSLLFWSFIIWLSINGLIFLYKKSDVNIYLLKRNFLISGILIVFFGIIGAISPFSNFMNFMTFGQNKRGINSIISVAGNTWRGFGASAESYGEYFGFIILFLFILFISKKIKVDNVQFILLVIGIVGVVYGLYKTNNFASALSLFLLPFLILLNQKVSNKDLLVKIKIVFILIVFVSLFFLIQMMNYEYVSTELLYESAQHSNLFENLDNHEKFLEITNYFNEGQIDGLLNVANEGKSSTTLTFLSRIYTQNTFNLPLIPNIVSIISLVSILINRTEMWGIFIAKYSPNLLESLFGNGPYQLNNYLFIQDIRLDVPDRRINSLFLPHSSFLDIIIFFGLVGFTFFIVYNAYLYFIKHKNSEYRYLLLFLIMNFSKSDSLLYISSVLLLWLVYTILDKEKT